MWSRNSAPSTGPTTVQEILFKVDVPSSASEAIDRAWIENTGAQRQVYIPRGANFLFPRPYWLEYCVEPGVGVGTAAMSSAKGFPRHVLGGKGLVA